MTDIVCAVMWFLSERRAKRSEIRQARMEAVLVDIMWLFELHENIRMLAGETLAGLGYDPGSLPGGGSDACRRQLNAGVTLNSNPDHRS